MQYQVSENIDLMKKIFVLEQGLDNQGAINLQLASGIVTSALSIHNYNQVYVVGQEIDLTSISCVPDTFPIFLADTEEEVVKVYCKLVTDENCSFQIFVNWWLLVYKTNSLDKVVERGWDGYYNGKIASHSVNLYKTTTILGDDGKIT